MVGDRNQKELRAYLADTKLNPFCLRPLLYLNPRPVERAQADAVRKLVAELFNNLLSADPAFQDCFDNAFRQRLEAYLMATVAVFNGAREALGKRPLPELLVTHMGNLPHRVFGRRLALAGRGSHRLLTRQTPTLTPTSPATPSTGRG